MPRPVLPDLPNTVTAVRSRFEAWRKARRPRSRIPDGLWREAAQLARAHGVHRICRVLRLDYYCLKHRMGAYGVAVSPPAFVEVALCPPASSPMSPQCVVEAERPDGARMTIRMAGSEDLVALMRTFWTGSA